MIRPSIRAPLFAGMVSPTETSGHHSWAPLATVPDALETDLSLPARRVIRSRRRFQPVQGEEILFRVAGCEQTGPAIRGLEPKRTVIDL